MIRIEPDRTMTEQDDLLLSQFLDGELTADEALTLRERLLAEPALRGRFESIKAANQRVQNALQGTAAGSVPVRARRMLDDGITDRAHLTVVRRAGWGLAIAASLLAASGLLLHPQWNQQAREPEAHIAQALEHSPSRGEGWEALPGDDRLRPILTFRNTAGQWCREYLLQGEGGGWHGVACREDAGWRTRAISEADIPGPATDYRPAGFADSGAVAAFIDTNAAGIPLDAREEAHLIASGWQ